MSTNIQPGPIGVFDSGYGGLTVLSEIQKLLPEYDYIYFGDNARAPYGTRSYEVVYEFTEHAVEKLFSMGCSLVIIACNTASAKALRTIQQQYLPKSEDPTRRVLGVIRPCTERIGEFSNSGHVGILATEGTVQSKSYEIEIDHFCEDCTVTQEACPMWVPLVENHAFDTEGGRYFIKHHVKNIIKADPQIDTLILACTHYPILKHLIEAYTPPSVEVIAQGGIVAESLRSYLERHVEMDKRCSKGGTVKYYTSENPEVFNKKAGYFLGKTVKAEKVEV